MGEQRWKANPGKQKNPRKPDRMLYLRFMGGYETPVKVRAGNYDWTHRGFDFDIREATEDDPKQDADDAANRERYGW